MPRTLTDAKLDTRSARGKLAKRPEPHWRSISDGLAIGYRKGAKGGTWIARHYTVEAGRRFYALGAADDIADADGAHVLNFGQAQAEARSWFAKLARHGRDAAAVGDAIDAYQPKLRGSDNKARLELHVAPALSKRPIALLTASELTKWRDGLTKTVAPATANRIATVLRAALNQRADADDTITSRRAWEIGLAAIEGAERSRNVILRMAWYATSLPRRTRPAPSSAG